MQNNPPVTDKRWARLFINYAGHSNCAGGLVVAPPTAHLFGTAQQRHVCHNAKADSKLVVRVLAAVPHTNISWHSMSAAAAEKTDVGRTCWLHQQNTVSLCLVKLISDTL